MPEFLEDPSVLTKEKLKSELLAHNVELPNGNPTKDVYVHLYLQKLTALNHKHVTAATTLDAFSSDEELPPPVVSSRSRSSGRKATRKTDKIKQDELDVTVLTDEGLRDELLKHGVDAGPIVATTRKLYERKLQKLLDNEPVQPPPVITEIQVNHNGNTDSDLYSDKEDEVTSVPEPEPEPEPEPVAEPEPVPVVVRPLRSRGKATVTSHTSNHQTLRKEELVKHQPKPRKDSSAEPVSLLDTAMLQECAPPDVPLFTRRQSKVPSSFLLPGSNVRSSSCTSTTSKEILVEKIAASEQTPRVEHDDVLKELFSNDNTPTGITATCRRPIRGAAGRPLKSSDIWNDENSLFSPKSTKTTTTTSSSFYKESHTINRVSSLPLSNSFNSTSVFTSRPLSAAPPAGQTKVVRRPTMSVWLKMFLLLIVAGFIFLVYQAMESNTLSPFESAETEVVGTSA